MNDWNTIHNPLWPWVCDCNEQGCLKLLHGICFNPVAMGLFLTQPMSTPAHCMCLGVMSFHCSWDNQIQMGGSLPITDEMHARNHPARIPTCAQWVADTPTNTRGNHFEIQFEWHINNSLLDHPWSKNYHHKNAKFGLCLVYALLFRVNIENFQGTMLVAQLAYLRSIRLFERIR